MEFRDHELDTKFATAAFSELSTDEAKRPQMVASSEWIIDFLEKRSELSADSQTLARAFEAVHRTFRTAGASGERLAYVNALVALATLYLELNLPLADAVRAAEADFLLSITTTGRIVA